MGFHRNVMDVRRYSFPFGSALRMSDGIGRNISPSLRLAPEPSSSIANGVRWPASVRNYAALADGQQNALGIFSPKTLRPVAVESTNGEPIRFGAFSKIVTAYHRSSSGPSFSDAPGWGGRPPSGSPDSPRAPAARLLYLKQSMAPGPPGYSVSPDKLYRGSDFSSRQQPGPRRKIGFGVGITPAPETESPLRTEQSGAGEYARRPSRYPSYTGSSDDRRPSRGGFDKTTYQKAQPMNQSHNDGNGDVGTDRRSGWPGDEATSLAAVSGGEREDRAKRLLQLDEHSSATQDSIMQPRQLAGEIWLDSVSLRDWIQASVRDSEFRSV